MSTMYTKIIFTQAPAAGFSFQTNAKAGVADYASQIPATATMTKALTSPTWNPFSATDADRTAWLVDTAGTIAEADARLACYGIAKLQEEAVATLTAACSAAIMAGFDSSALGASYHYPQKATDQQNLAGSVLDAMMIRQDSSAWIPSTAYAVGDTAVVAGEYLVVTIAGTSGGTAPTVPAVGSTVVDGGVTWAVWTTPFWCQDNATAATDPTGSWAYHNHTVSQIGAVGAAGKNSVANKQLAMIGYGAQINAAADYTTIQTIVSGATWA